MQGLSTVAGILAAAAAAVLALTVSSSLQNPDNHRLWVATNAFWFISLILAVSCSVWAQVVAYQWARQPHSDTLRDLEKFSIRWVALLLLFGSGGASGAGVTCMAFVLFPHTAIPIIVSALVGFMALVGLWIAIYWTAKWVGLVTHGQPLRAICAPMAPNSGTRPYDG